LDWDEEPLIVTYYNGLKDSVKDEVARQERPDDIQDMIELAVKIDNRLYERQLERGNKGLGLAKVAVRNSLNQQSKKKGRAGRFQKKRTYGDPMELDSIKRSPPPRGRRPLNSKQEAAKEKGTCFSCGKTGHFSRDCKKKQLNLIQEPPMNCWSGPYYDNEKDAQHALLHWTGCYEDGCWIHRSSKDHADWYPREPVIPEPPEEREMSFNRGTKQAVASHERRQEKKRVRQRNSTPRKKFIPHLQLRTEIGGRKVTVMIDSGSHGNFICRQWIKENNIPWQPKETPYQIRTIDGGLIKGGHVTAETKPVIMVIENHKEEMRFDIIEMDGHDAVLGMPWLATHNPRIDWKESKVAFPAPQCKEHCSNQQEAENLGSTDAPWQTNHTEIRSGTKGYVPPSDIRHGPQENS
jgi:hypothetical protein